MPKVSREYLDQKRTSLIQAAFQVFKAKPLYEITMKDIIRAGNISQGGIYRYFSDVDELLAEMIDRCNPNADYSKEIDEVLAGSDSPTAAIKGLFSFLGNYIQDNASTVGKVLFELTILMANQPARGRKIQSKIKDGQSGLYFLEKMTQVIHEGIASGYFHPVLPEDYILSFISTAIDGIAVDGALFKCYGVPQRMPVAFDIPHLMGTLSASVLALLCPDQNENRRDRK